MTLPENYGRPDCDSIAIIGAGIIGLTTAWRLLEEGYRPVLFERTEPAQEASWAGAGMLAPGGEAVQPGFLSSVAAEARALYDDFVPRIRSESSVAIDFQTAGALDLAYTPEEEEQLLQRGEAQRAWGIASRSLAAKEIGTYWPRVQKDNLRGGRFYVADAVVDPRNVANALLKILHARGAVFVRGRSIGSVKIEREGVQVGDRLFAAVVLAAGAWSSTVTVPGHTLPAVEPMKGVLLGYQQPLETCSTIVRHQHTYLLQRASGLLIAGATAERAGFDKNIDSAAVEELGRRAAAIMPHLGDTTPTLSWAGLRPWADRIHVEQFDGTQLFLAYGHGRNGILLAAWTAREIARLIRASLGKP